MDRQMLRLLSFLAKDKTGCAMTPRGAATFLEAGERGTISVPTQALDEAARRGLTQMDGDTIALTPAGLAWLARTGYGTDRFQAQHQERLVRQVEVKGAFEPAMVNLRESPLAALAQRKDRNGQAFLSQDEFAAGERFRADYEFGRIAPRLGANWEAAVSGGKRSGANAKADLSDNALAARQRVNRAIEAVGPELTGVLIDICCFLKGVEQVESERSWPRRSAKLMLKTALGALARHYAPPRKARTMVHWGTSDYRPEI